jgi:hypothetical protein
MDSIPSSSNPNKDSKVFTRRPENKDNKFYPKQPPKEHKYPLGPENRPPGGGKRKKRTFRKPLRHISRKRSRTHRRGLI